MNENGLSAVIEELSGAVALDAREMATLIEGALVTAYRRMQPDAQEVAAEVDLDGGTWKLTATDSTGTLREVPLEGDLARQCAQSVRAAVMHRLRDVAKDSVIRDAGLLRGRLVDAIVEGKQGSHWMLRIGEHFGLLPPEEQISNDKLQLHQHLKVVVIDFRRRSQDAVLVVSRTDPQLIRLLLEQEVPEISNGQVEVKAIAREAGRRTKVAVSAPRGDVDPRGACIGPKGVRHRAITQELGDEQVQVVNWSDDLATYVGNALAPAEVKTVTLDEETRTANVVVRPDQLSLAIGRGGENARLVARLTGWRIDIRGEE